MSLESSCYCEKYNIFFAVLSNDEKKSYGTCLFVWFFLRKCGSVILNGKYLMFQKLMALVYAPW